MFIHTKSIFCNHKRSSDAQVLIPKERKVPFWKALRHIQDLRDHYEREEEAGRLKQPSRPVLFLMSVNTYQGSAEPRIDNSENG